MNSEKLHIPFPEEQRTQTEVDKIVNMGVKPKRSFLSYLIQLYKIIGLRYLFINRRDGLLLCFSILIILTYLSNAITETARIESDVYSFLFIVSPLVYMTLSLYDYFHKQQNKTIEVEMTTKLNIYQVTAFKMLVFSVISILVNMICITMLSIAYEEIHFIKAALISTTALFLFSIIFLAVLIHKQTRWAAISVIFGWVGLNIALIMLQKHLYMNIILKLPIFVYGIVLIASMIVYFQYLNRLVHMTPAKER